MRVFLHPPYFNINPLEKITHHENWHIHNDIQPSTTTTQVLTYHSNEGETGGWHQWVTTNYRNILKSECWLWPPPRCNVVGSSHHRFKCPDMAIKCCKCTHQITLWITSVWVLDFTSSVAVGGLARCECVCARCSVTDWNPIQTAYPHYIQFSWDKLWNHRNRDQGKAVTNVEWMDNSCHLCINPYNGLGF